MKKETTKKSVAEKRELINHKINSNIEHNKSTKQNSQEIYSFTGSGRLDEEEIKFAELAGLNIGGYYDQR